ncbi:MAG TPA: Dabb family protein [Vicinamibacteria bacterium]|nr:Dabb family protein [Vicinamibacteria bacterium]
MNPRSTLSLLVLAGIGLAMSPVAPAAEAGRSLAHDVYFTLRDASPEAKQKLVDACRLYLTGHEGTVFFAAGVRAEEMTREVNDLGFDVGLHVYFRDKAAHDAYQDHPRHQQFIAEMNANWKTVRVFDSWVETTR